MRRHRFGTRLLRWTALAVTAAAGPAAAGPLTTATWSTQLDASFHPPILAEGFAVARGTDAGGLNGCVCVSLTMPAFEGVDFLLPATGGGVIPIARVLTLGGSQHLDGTRNAIVATAGIPGEYRVMVAQHVAKGTLASMYEVGPTTLLRVPLSIGVDATAMGTATILSSPHVFTVYNGAWTGGTIAFTGLTSMNLPLPDVVAEGHFFPPHDGHPGTITLVAPTRIHVNGSIVQRRTVSLTYLTMDFDYESNALCVPEPETVALLAAALAGLLSVPRRNAA